MGRYGFHPVLLVHPLLVMHRSPFCREQKQDRFVFIRSHKVLPGIGFFLPRVAGFPVPAIFRALDRSLRSIYEQIFHIGKERWPNAISRTGKSF